jgi:hypothetical protein
MRLLDWSPRTKTLLLSDLIGGAGESCWAIPAVKDQCYRFKSNAQKRKRENSPWPGLNEIIRAAWEERRNDYDGRDSVLTMAGALGITLSFIIKLFET